MDHGSSGARATTRPRSERSWRMRVLVTREELAARVESLGHDPVFCELIRVEPLGDQPVDARAYDWLVVTSRNGAHELARRGVTANRIAAIGPATAEALESHGLHVDLVAATHTQEGLRDELPGGSLLLAAAEGARRDVLEADFLPLYRTIELRPDVPDADVALLMSGSAARALSATGARLPVVAIGPRTAAEARAAGLEVIGVATTHDLEGLVEALRSSSWSSPS
ncbi:MAG: uroporphyrinogen-III synthase [Actinobacteria bacterium]|nr:MAG: uroporphyrinogen-III synthase [Actinomycetota bacterium]